MWGVKNPQSLGKFISNQAFYNRDRANISKFT